METPAHRYEALCVFTPWDLQVIRETVTELSKSARMHVRAACLTPSGFSPQASQHSGSKGSKPGPSAKLGTYRCRRFFWHLQHLREPAAGSEVSWSRCRSRGAAGPCPPGSPAPSFCRCSAVTRRDACCRLDEAELQDDHVGRPELQLHRQTLFLSHNGLHMGG